MRNSIKFPSLLSCNLLADMPHAEKSAFIDGCKAQRYTSLTPILRQGDMPDGMVIIAEGSVEVAYVDEDGNQTIIYLSTAGDKLGLIEAVAQRPYAATCTAFPCSTVLHCPQSALTARLNSQVFLRNFAGNIYDMIARDNRMKAVLQFYTSEQRICQALHDLSAAGPELRLSQSYLASVAGCSRQTVNRELALLRESGAITLGKGRVTVENRVALLDRIAALDS